VPVHSIYDDAPATRWEDAFLAGNGEFGIMVFGDPYHEQIVHTHHRYVLPNGSVGLRPPDVAERLEQVRDLIMSGEPLRAQRVFSDGRTLAWTQPFHPGHVLQLDTVGSTSAGDDAANGSFPPAETSDYRRTTCYSTGEVTTVWTGPGGRFVRRAIVSRADAVAVVDVTGPDLDLEVRLSLDLPGRPPSVIAETRAWSEGDRETGDRHAGQDALEAWLSATGSYTPRPGGPGFLGVTRLLVEGGRVDVHDGVVHVYGAQRMTLLTRMDRSIVAAPNTESLCTSLASLPTDYDVLLARHTDLHTPLYQAAEFDLGACGIERGLPVAELLARSRAQADSGELDPALAEAMFHSGRYLLLSSSGVLPPRLTGVWLGAWGAAWSGDFTTDANINLQMAAASLTGMPELIEPYAALIADQIEDWRTNARTIYGMRGILAPSRTDGEHGLLFHLDDDWPWAMWVAGADWLLCPLHEYWQVTGNDAFLSERLAPWLGEAARFFEDFLTRRDGDGRLVLVPSYSPEVGPENARGVAGVNATMDLAAARHALITAAEAYTYLGIEPESVARWRELAADLPPYRLDAMGALAEWAWPGLDTAENHRHVSHLYPVWPLHDITPDETPELAAAARTALLRRGDENYSAHGSLHRALCAARLKDTATARANLLKILGRDMIFRSLMTSHNPGLETYNADAAHALPAVIAELLADSRPGMIELLPALPEEWLCGTVRGLRTRTGATLDKLHWDQTEGVVHAVVTSPHEQTVTLVCRAAHEPADRRRDVHLPAHEPITVAVRI